MLAAILKIIIQRLLLEVSDKSGDALW